MKKYMFCAILSGVILTGPVESVFRMAEYTYLPVSNFAERNNRENVHRWLANQALAMLPVESFHKEESIYLGEFEDRVTFGKVLARKISQKEESPAQEEAVKMEVIQKNQEPVIVPEKLHDFQYLMSKIYTVDSTTMIGPEQLNVDELLAKNMHVDKSAEGPKVLVFHTHSQEAFADSVAGDCGTSIVGVGEYLSQLLNQKGICALHDTSVYDLIDGKLDRSKAYEYSEAGVRKILEEHPSIEVVIDLHRDGVGENTRLVTSVNGKETAKIMFFNGLSRTKKNGDIAYLKNPYIQDNLSFSLQMQLASEQMYPGFARKIYLKGYRYSLHMKPKSLLIEAGAQTNTVQEMKNAMELLSDVLVKVVG